jgi:hypothetical protein
MSLEAVWYSCDMCKYKTQYRSYIKEHKAIHLSADASQWYNCDKCDFKTTRNGCLEQHKKNHLSADAAHWYSCDICEFKDETEGHSCSVVSVRNVTVKQNLDEA